MTGCLSGKAALATAAAQGIGRAAAGLFAAEGATVWETGINMGKGRGAIVNIDSVASFIKGVPNRFVCDAGKADFVGKGIRCSSICPATVETPSLHDRINACPTWMKRAGRRAGGLHRSPAHGTPVPGRGDREHVPLSGVRRRALRDGRGIRHRRRHDRLTIGR